MNVGIHKARHEHLVAEFYDVGVRADAINVIAIISTSKGLMTDKEARKNAIGGEVLAYIW